VDWKQMHHHCAHRRAAVNVVVDFGCSTNVN
jgi:hypothetical protein